MTSQETQYDLIARTLPLLAGDARLHWKAAASAAGLSPTHYQRVFKRHTGVSPRQYAACHTLVDVKRRLAEGESVFAAAVDAGLSGGGRAHDLFLNVDAMTPGQYAGGDVDIAYGVAASPFGRVFVAATARGICCLRFLLPADVSARESTGAACATAEDAALALLRRDWPHASLREDEAVAARWARRAFADAATPLHVRGTNFQIKVWQALLAIPVGAAVSYKCLARTVNGRAQAARAVAGAAAANPVAVLIPCHRLLGADGALTGYAWGMERKRALLAVEFARDC